MSPAGYDINDETVGNILKRRGTLVHEFYILEGRLVGFLEEGGEIWDEGS